MLNPLDRQLYLDALKPPVGYELDRAVATTFSLDLTTLLTVPLGFALLDWDDSQGRLLLDPVALLHSLRKYADRITVFCQAGRIATPAKQHPLFAHLERMIVEVHAAKPHGVFHPKVWLLRFLSKEAPVRYRLLCMSRNLTSDRSWDTLLTLEGDLADRERAYSRNHPLGDFFGALPDLAHTAVSRSLRRDLARISEEVRRVKFEPPEPFEDEIDFRPLGLPGYQRLSFGDRTDRMLVLSPFISDDLLASIVEPGHHILISRPESLDAVDPDVLRRFSEIYILDDDALEEDTDNGENEDSSDSGADTLPVEGDTHGLHAKLFIVENGWNASVWTGSANSTHAAFHDNVEFLVQLQGKKSKVGPDAFLGEGERSVGFRSLLKPYKTGSKKEVDPERKANEERVELARRALSRASLFLAVEKCEGALYTLVLNGSDALQLEAARGKCWPITLNPAYGASLESLCLGKQIPFPNLTIHALTSFIAFEVSAGDGSKAVTVRFVLNLPLQGAPNDRLDAVLRLVLRDRAQLLRYLIFLLAREEDKVGATMSLLLGCNGGSEMAAGQPDAIPLFEELVRTLARAPDKLDVVRELVDDLRTTPEGTSLLPEGFDSIWGPIWTARSTDKDT